MCGIVGIVSNYASVPPQSLELATRSLAHRGPDDSGTIIFRDSENPAIEIGLGNRRLAILDLSPLGHQPMSDPATGNCIVYNGELYNFLELRARLERSGVHFRSRSDTEVILHAYAQWGEDCLNEFRGMLAIAIWDAARHRLFLARDPMGIKPLYYYNSDRYFIFSSEVRAILATGLVPRTLDRTGLAGYLTFGSLCEPDTLIEGVHSLPPACSLTWKDGSLQQTQYWDFAAAAHSAREFAAASSTDRFALESEVAELVDESVRMQIISDVPVGVFLSGGIDSSSLVGILRRSGIRPSTFSIVFREAEFSEAAYSRAIASLFKTDHHEITVSESDFFSAIDPALDAMDLPTIDGINTYFVSQQARAAGIKVALSGLGGDEIFAGYSSFRTVPRMERFSSAWKILPSTVRSPLIDAFGALAPSSDQSRKLVAFFRNGNESIHPYFVSRMLFTPQQQKQILPPAAAPGLPASSPQMTGLLHQAAHLDPINRISFLESRCYMLNTLLRDSDFMSLAHGLEVRVPLIDHRLAARTLALPGSWKLNDATPKPLLVNALRGQLPFSIVHRPKRGFTLPFATWMRQQMRPTIEQAFAGIAGGPLASLVDSHAANAILQDFFAGRTSWSRPWSLYVLQRWCERHSLSS